MNDNQFEAMLSAIIRLSNRIDSLSNTIAEAANMLHLDAQDAVASLDSHGRAVDELVEVIRNYRDED